MSSADLGISRHPKEQRYYVIALVISILIYVALTISIIGLFYGSIFAAFMFCAQGVFIGRLRGNGVLVSSEQFPDVFTKTAAIAQRLGMLIPPAVYILQEGGFLNAFATRFFGRNFLVIYSDVLELAYQRGEDAVAFVIAHEMGHLKLGHTWKRALLTPALIVPLLVPAYLRACEYSCDAIGVALEPRGAVDGLTVLAAGKHLYTHVNIRALSAQAAAPQDFWMWLGEHLAGHPNLPKRVRAAIECGAEVAR